MYLRPYRAGDLERMYAMDVACFDPRFRFSKHLLKKLASAHSGITTLACADPPHDGGELLGFCIAALQRMSSEQVGYIATLDVDPSKRRQGIGKQLLGATEAALVERGAIRIWLHVWTGNQDAARLYGSMGYRGQRLESNFYGVGLDAEVFCKSLAVPT